MNGGLLCKAHGLHSMAHALRWGKDKENAFGSGFINHGRGAPGRAKPLTPRLALEREEGLGAWGPPLPFMGIPPMTQKPPSMTLSSNFYHLSVVPHQGPCL